MKNIKKAMIAVFGTASLMMPLGMGAVAHAATCEAIGQEECIPLQPITNPLLCSHDPDSHGDCDLSVDKLVSVNGGAFVEADTSADAAQAHVGDTITYKIIVTNNSTEGFTPTGALYVGDILPSAGVSYVSSSATSGSYDISGFFANYWYLPLVHSCGEVCIATNLPATLTITTTSISTGLFQNTATLAHYDPGSCDGGQCPYSDADPSNDSNDAWIDPSAPPVVLADSTLVNTGSGTALQTIAAGTLIAATAATLLAGRRRGYRAER